MDLFLKKSIDN